MIRVTTHKALQNHTKLDFCYLCGKAFDDGSKTNRDHVPPKAIFLPDDRLNPLILPTHVGCNQSESGEDELVSQLVSALHRRLPRPERQRLQFIGGRLKPDGQPIAFTSNVNLACVVWRWVRGFHAALYRQYLPRSGHCFVHPPFPSGRREGERLIRDPILPQQTFVPEEIKKNRIARNLDVLKCWNGKCYYESVFVRADNGQPICFWALRLYDWEKLADPRWLRSHGCIGAYEASAGIPQEASRGTKLDFPFPNTNPLDPFEE